MANWVKVCEIILVCRKPLNSYLKREGGETFVRIPHIKVEIKNEEL